MTSKEKRQRAPMKWRIFMGVIIIVAIIVLVFVWGLSKKKDLSGKVKTHTIDVDKERFEAGHKATPEYTKKIKDVDQTKAKEAEKKGNTYIATAVVDDSKTEQILDDLDDKTNKKKAVKVKKREIQTNTRELKQRQQDLKRRLNEQKKEREKIENLYAKAISDEMSDLGKRFGISKHAINVYDPITTKKQDDKKIEEKRISEIKVGILKPGDLIYCQNEIELNSDIPGPVVLTTIHGKNGKFFGSFKKHDKYLLLELTSFVEENGKSHKIKAYAVDPETPKVAIRSRVDNRYFTRWASLIAASFLDGWGEAVESSGSALAVSDGIISTAKPDYTTEDQAWIATGKVAEELKKPALKYFKRGATVYLDAYTPVGVLIIEG